MYSEAKQNSSQQLAKNSVHLGTCSVLLFYILKIIFYSNAVRRVASEGHIVSLMKSLSRKL